MSSPAPAKQKISARKSRKKMQGNTSTIYSAVCLLDGQRIITCSRDGSIRVWDLKSGKQVGDSWDEGNGEVVAISLSPDGKRVVCGSCDITLGSDAILRFDGTVTLWDVDTGKAIKKLTRHTGRVISVCWSPDGERVVSVSKTATVWDVESGETILGPIDTGDQCLSAVCYSPDGKMIALGGSSLTVWDVNTGEMLTGLDGSVSCLAWTSDGHTLIAAGSEIRKFDPATWTETILLDGDTRFVDTISLSPNERILASVSWSWSSDTSTRTPTVGLVQLWNFETNQPIGSPLNHKNTVTSTSFSADGKLLTTVCDDHHLYTWDVSAIVREAGLDDLLSENGNAIKKQVSDVDVTQPRASQIEDTRRIVPPRSFDARDPADFSTSRSYLSYNNRRRDRRTRAPISYVEEAAPKRRNYHARGKKPPATSPRPPVAHVTQQPPATAPPSTSFAAAGSVGATGTMPRPDITVRQAGWWTRFLLRVTCVSVEYTEGRH